VHVKYRRVLLFLELDADDATEAVAVVRRVAPAAEQLHILAHVPETYLAWLTGSGDQMGRLLDRLRQAAAGAAANVESRLLVKLDADTISDLARETGIDLLALGQPTRRAVSVAAEVRKRLALPVLYARSSARRDRPIAEILCASVGSRARRAVAGFLRDHGTPELHATLLVPRMQAPADLAGDLDVAGIAARVTVASQGRDTPTDLLVLARFPGALLSLPVWPAPVLVLPPLPPYRALPTHPVRRSIDVPDLIEVAGTYRARVLYAEGAGRQDPIPDQDIAVVVRGRVQTTVHTRDGDAEIPAAPGARSLGLFRISEREQRDPLDAIEQKVEVIHPGSRPLVVFDSELSDADLAVLASVRGPDGPDLLAVRLRAIRSCRAIRSRLRAAGLVPRVVDGSAILDEGAASDVGEDLDSVRLARVAARLRGAAGFPVAAIVHRESHPPETVGFAALTTAQITTGIRWPPEVAVIPRSTSDRLEATTGARLIAGNRIAIELDNTTARHWLLEAIAGAKQRVHYQVYMALDDDVGVQVEAALAAAAARRVVVRVVVDSLHGLEGSFGARNPLLERLKTKPGVDLRVLRPITGAPSLVDLKQRDHRKVAVVDGALALLGGRNLSHEYYTGFAEVRLTPQSPWRQVPWLDAGARVEGPAVAELDRSFLDAWTAAGGAPFGISTPPEAGPSAVRVVVHQGLRDARTLEAYLALIEGAQSHIYTVNGFPLMLELQHALVRAIRRGVRVRSLIGNLTPTHAGTRFKGPWGTVRAAATEFVHSRFDGIVAVGGEGYVFAVPEQPQWTAGLGVIHPHVHAKVISVDGRVCTVGSANLDLTAGYWEDELMLVVEDAAITGALEARIDELLARSDTIDRDDPTWRETARRREWMRHWPGVLSI
jgi:phosphatidylserine/phosphatidylglycerophosphate/cardiolipin synthase-like enzyme